jgi:hypothetical protein
MNKLISECLSQDSFSRLTHKILIRNETSHTLLSKPELVIIKELKENGVLLEMPINVCQKGHALTLFFLYSDVTPKTKLQDKGPYKEAFMEAVAKVLRVEKNLNNPERVIVDLNFTQNDAHQWKEILEKYAANQEKIDQMLKLKLLNAKAKK